MKYDDDNRRSQQEDGRKDEDGTKEVNTVSSPCEKRRGYFLSIVAYQWAHGLAPSR